MSKEIIVNVENEQTRIAIVEDSKLAELYIENAENKRTIGNIYLGQIRKVMPSIQAAFVDIGQEQDAFLHFSDLSENTPYQLQLLQQNSPSVEKVDLPEDGPNTEGKPPSRKLSQGDSVLVQITKEPISNKGSRISTDLSIAGRFLVLVPLQKYIAVSRKITNQKERRRLKALASSLVPEGFGVIVRTVAEGRDAKSLDKDLRLLMERWRRVEKELQGKTRPPKLVYEDVDMASSIIRDQFSDDFERILVDHKPLFHSIRSYVRAVAPKMVDRVEFHEADSPVFEATDIQQGADRAFEDRVEMPSGGYLFIEQTEAMHVVDVNSGRSGRGKSQSQNSLDVNLEAADVIVRQIRLRDLGGIIVVDFIDLRDEKDRQKVYERLKQGFKDDRAVTKVLPMSDFGLVEITRQRLRPSITTTFSSPNGSAEGDDVKADDLEQAERQIRLLQRKVTRRERELERLRESTEAEPSGDAAQTQTATKTDAGVSEEEANRLRNRVNELEKKAKEARDRQKELKQEAERQRKRAEENERRVRNQEKRMRELQSKQTKQSGAQSEAQSEPSGDGQPVRESNAFPTAQALVDDIEDWIVQHKKDRRTIALHVHPFTAAYLNRPVPSYVTTWFMDHLVRVHLETDDDLSPMAYRIVDPRSGDTLTDA